MFWFEILAQKLIKSICGTLIAASEEIDKTSSMFWIGMQRGVTFRKKNDHG